MRSVFEDKKECSGCGACVYVCPKNAIEMVEDEEGFLYPRIDPLKCIDCGLCRKICTFKTNYDVTNNLQPPLVYAAKNKDKAIRKKSSSGGMFTALSDYVLALDGIVIGACFTENMQVVHKLARTKKEASEFRGSKYIQSDLKIVFKKIKTLLKEDKFVLFTGLPCQVSSLKGFLKDVNTDKLILCDLICHGVGSPLIWKEFIKSLYRKNKSKVVNYYFRPKLKGWRDATSKVVYQNQKVDCDSFLSQNYKSLYFSRLIMRPSCHNCKYTNLARVGDLTIGDFWGIENSKAFFEDQNGVSLLLVNTLKGKAVFQKIQDNLDYLESNTKECLQPQLQKPTIASKNRSEFWKDYRLKGYPFVVNKYLENRLKDKVKRLVKRFLKG